MLSYTLVELTITTLDKGQGSPCQFKSFFGFDILNPLVGKVAC